MEPKDLLMTSQERDTELYPEPVKSSPQLHTVFIKDTF
jgi:hypothetical protein